MCEYIELRTSCELRRLWKNGVWLQQDGATAHTARQIMKFLKGMFSGRLLSEFQDLPILWYDIKDTV
jgi:hypothetical protein